MARLTKIEVKNIRDAAPEVPPETCPNIDFVIDRLDDFKFPTESDQQRQEMIVAVMEYIRVANDTLRQSSYYWYQEWNKLVK